MSSEEVHKPPKVLFDNTDELPTQYELEPIILVTVGFGEVVIKAISEVDLHPNSLIAVKLYAPCKVIDKFLVFEFDISVDK